MKIVIDTNAIFGDWKLDTPHSRLLLAASAADEVEVIVPEVVVLEAIGGYGRRLQEAAQAQEKARRTLGRLDVTVEAADIDIPASTAGYEGYLRGRLADGRVRAPEPTGSRY